VSFKNKTYLPTAIVFSVIGVLILLGCIADTSAQPAEKGLQPKFTELTVGLPQVPLTLISLSPLIANGQAVGGIAVYDDPTTERPADYLEVFDSKGAVVVVSWFDRFGIERLVVDRALIEGGDELQGVLVTLLDGESI
jgi:hypothetical protein